MDVMFFAKLREDVGAGNCSVSFAELGLQGFQSLEQVLSAMLSKPELSNLSRLNLGALKSAYDAQSVSQSRPKLLASVNQCLVDDFSLACVDDDAEVAFFPPVSGG